MIIKSAVFVKSSQKLSECPDPVFPEHAFIGRSNVGKSSLINMIVNKKNLARISVTPGKTQVINHFLINAEWYLADLPGLGYAKVSQETRKKWNLLISDYLLKRKNLVNTFILIDSRISPQAIDLDIMHELSDYGIPFTLVFTKKDKLTPNELNRNIQLYRRTLHTELHYEPIFHITSSVNKEGRELLLKQIREENKHFNPGITK